MFGVSSDSCKPVVNIYKLANNDDIDLSIQNFCIHTDIEQSYICLMK